MTMTIDFFRIMAIRLRTVALSGSMQTVRVTIALSSVIWAILLWWPGELFNPARTTYRLMGEIASEELWGAAFFIHSAFAWHTLLCARYNRVTFIGDALFGAMLWTVATVACFAAHWQHGIPYAPPAAMSAEVGVLLASWWYLLRWVARK